MTRAALYLLAAGVIIALAIAVLVGLHDDVPAEFWAIDFSLITGAGVAIQHPSGNPTAPPS